jgi:AcrR family transcriptional regulator
MSSADTKTRLLDAAEKLFSERGFAATSVRDVTGEAGVNLAAVNYHFGTRAGLIRGVFDRRLTPLNSARLSQLEQCSCSGPEDLDCVLRALVAPFADVVRESRDSGVHFVRLLGRAHFEPDPVLRQLITQSFSEVAARFARALHACAPHLDRQEAHSRLFFAIGALTVIADRAMFDGFSTREGDLARLDLLVEHLVAFLRAGFEAAATEVDS